MRLHFTSAVLAASLFVGDSFTASPRGRNLPTNVLQTTTNPDHVVETEQATQEGNTATDIDIDIADIFPMPEETQEVVPLTSEEFIARLNQQLARLREKDQTSRHLREEVCFKRSV